MEWNGTTSTYADRNFENLIERYTSGPVYSWNDTDIVSIRKAIPTVGYIKVRINK